MKGQIGPKPVTLSPSGRTSPAELTERSGDLVKRGLQLLESLDDRATHEGLTKPDLTDVPALSPSQPKYVFLPDLTEAGQVRRLKRGRHLATLTSNVGVSVEVHAGGAIVREVGVNQSEWEIDCPVSSYCAALDPAARWLVLGAHYLVAWDLRKRVISGTQEIGILEDVILSGSRNRYLDRSEGGTYLFGLSSGSVRAWRMPDFNESILLSPPPPPPQPPPPVVEYIRYQEMDFPTEFSMTMATDRSDALLAAVIQGLWIWDLANGTPIAGVDSPLTGLAGLRFSSDSAHLIAAYAGCHAASDEMGQADSMSYRAWKTAGLMQRTRTGRPGSSPAGTAPMIVPLVEEPDFRPSVSEWPASVDPHAPGKASKRDYESPVITSEDGRVEARDVGDELAVFATDTRKELSRFGGIASDSVVLSRDGRIVAFAGWDARGVFPGAVILADTASGEVLQRLTWPLRGFREPIASEPLEESDEYLEHGVAGLALSPDSGYLIVAFSHWLLLWDVNKRRVVLQHEADFGYGVAALAFSANGKVCAYAAESGVGAIRLDLKLHWGSLSVREPSAIAVNEDGSLAAVGFPDGKVAVYSLPEFAVLRSYPRGHVSPVVRLSFSDDRATVTSECEDGVAREWGLGTV